jgi:predicted DNA-binding ribbon-helix-helix protein|tara:strand:+ start:1536 stop:1664 length:129 start_codon:yes stop_codon:yes gene_type:complete
MFTPDEMMRNEQLTEEFWKEVESEAEKYEVTVDYYLAEFYCS